MWVPREQQGQGRHDAPDRYGALYVTESPVSAIAEQLARFRGRPFRPAMLIRRGRPLAMVRYELGDECQLVDLDDPATLLEASLRPSQVATRVRHVTRQIATEMFAERSAACGLRWWSTLEASWINVTLFAERARRELRAGEISLMTPDDGIVIDACRALGLRM